MSLPCKKHFPGAFRKQGKKTGPGFQTAGGGELKCKGEFEVQWEDQCGHSRDITFQDADVSMPIMSISKRGKEGYKSRFDDEGGELVHKQTGGITPWIARMGVHFVKTRVPRDIVGKAATTVGRPAP